MNPNSKMTESLRSEVSFVPSEITEAGHSSSSGHAGYAYNEMADVPVQWIDPVAEVQKNLAHLEDLQARMRFMMREIRYLMKA